MPASLAAPTSGRRLDWGQITLWAARVSWLAVAVIGGRAVGDAIDGRSDPVRAVATIGAWAGWSVGAVALAVTGLVTLTTVRAVVPIAIVAAGLAAVSGAPAGSVLSLAVPAAVTAVLVAAADTGHVYMQASAYGDERRFGLRPPLGYLLPTVASWGIWAAALIAAPLSWAARSWVLAAVSTVVLGAGSLLLPRRWHQLTMRWLVTVPAGLVVHDPVVLADTLMMPTRQITGVGLGGPARADGAYDLTGPTPGVTVRIELVAMTTAVLAPRPSTPQGTAIHLAALLVAPSRPGAMLREAARRGVPVR